MVFFGRAGTSLSSLIFFLGPTPLPLSSFTIGSICSLNLEAFVDELREYPSPRKEYVLAGIRDGFRVGFIPERVVLRPSLRNLKSASQHPDVIDKYLSAEVAHRRVAGPYPNPPLPSLQTSPFGVIPKRHQPGKWRLILDLSSPQGASVNDGIPKDPFSMRYISVDDAIRSLVDIGPGALMAKLDVQAAYRNIPINVSDRHLLGIYWRDSFYVDLVLPFGLRSAPFIFDSVASAVHWILSHNYHVHPLFHYLDDFLTLGPPSSPVFPAHVDTSFTVFNHLGLPLNHEKCEGPATCLVFLGIELDSVTQIARLPAEKFNRSMSLLQSWSNKRTCHRQELESLIGHLHHACKVVRPGRTFLRRMIDLLAHFRNRSHPIRLNVDFRRDVHWWLAFFRDWNGISFFLYSPGVSQLPDLFVASDAAGSIGFGAMWRSHWCFGSWSFLSSPQSIAFMELLPIVVAAHLWGASC